MQRRFSGRVGGALLRLIAGAVLGGCEIPVPDPVEFLEWVYIPQDRIGDVSPLVTPSVYFSDDLEGSTINAETVRLESTTTTATEKQTANDVCTGLQNTSTKTAREARAAVKWTSVPGTPAIDAQNPRRAIFTPEGNKLLSTTCYRLSFFTEIRGRSVGPLIPVDYLDKGVAFEVFFYTRDQ